MALFQINNVNISGLSAIVPANRIDNRDYTWISEQERELLIKTTGIESRRIVNNEATVLDLAYEGAKQLIERLRWDKSEIDLLILVTQSPDYIIPATSIILQEKLGLGKNCLAFDINLGCSGYVYGLSVASSMISAGAIKKGLLVVGDVSSKGINPKDKSTAPLFSDAAAITALEYKEGAEPLQFCLQSDGKGFEAIIIPDGGIRNPISDQTLVEQEFEKGIIRNKRQLILNGLDIFNFSLREVAPNINNLLNHFSINKEEVDYWVFHQANLLMNEMVRKKMKLPSEKVPYSLKEYGNTSSATIPLTIINNLSESLKSGPKKLVLSGFGVGLSWGSCCVNLKNPVVLPIIDYK